MVLRGKKIPKPRGKLGILLVGLGAVSTTFIAGLEAVRRGFGEPFGSLSQMGTVRLGKRTEHKVVKINKLLPLNKLKEIEVGAWDIFSDNAFEAAVKAGVLEKELLNKVKPFLQSLKPMPAVFEQRFVKKLKGRNVKRAKTKMGLVEQVMADIENFKRQKKCQRLVIIYCASTEVYHKAKKVHQNLRAFERGLKNNHPDIAPSQIYAYAALKTRTPFANGSPSLAVDIPALKALAQKNNVAIAGKDFKTGQTLLKTIIAPGLKARLLGVNGWFSTNILGNRDGEVLDDPGSFRTKEISKTEVLKYILQSKLYPKLYKNLYHKIRINYYPPRGDNKESWDNIDIFGWLGYPMAIKIDFLCRDSILAAPIVLDLILFLDLSQRARMGGIQEWLSFYFKSPMAKKGLYPEHDLFIQLMKLKNTLRYLMKEKVITHLGLDYYFK